MGLRKRRRQRGEMKGPTERGKGGIVVGGMPKAELRNDLVLVHSPPIDERAAASIKKTVCVRVWECVSFRVCCGIITASIRFRASYPSLRSRGPTLEHRPYEFHVFFFFR
jgi:hypothetical protein